MKKTAKAGEFFNSAQYRIQQSYDVRRHDGLVAILMDNYPAVVTEAQWEKACAQRVTWDDEDIGEPDEDLCEIWNKLMQHDIASTPRGKRAITAALDELRGA